VLLPSYAEPAGVGSNTFFRRLPGKPRAA